MSKTGSAPAVKKYQIAGIAEIGAGIQIIEHIGVFNDKENAKNANNNNNKSSGTRSGGESVPLQPPQAAAAQNQQKIQAVGELSEVKPRDKLQNEDLNEKAVAAFIAFQKFLPRLQTSAERQVTNIKRSLGVTVNKIPLLPEIAFRYSMLLYMQLCLVTCKVSCCLFAYRRY